MPVFEYRCEACRHKFAVLVGMTAGEQAIQCPACGGTQAEKLVSRFVRGKTEDDRIDEMADRLELYGEPPEGQEARRLMRELGKATDEDMADEMEEMYEADMEGRLEDDA